MWKTKILCLKDWTATIFAFAEDKILIMGMDIECYGFSVS